MAEPNKTQKTFISKTSFFRCLTLSLSSALLYSAGAFVPFIGAAALLFSPTPLALLGVRENIKWMIPGLTIAGLFLYLLFGPWFALYFLVGEGLLCFGLALPPGRVKKGSEALFFCTTVSIVSKILFMGMVVVLTGNNPFILKTDALRSLMMQMYSGMWGQDATAFKESMEQIVTLAPYMLPSLIVLSSMLDSFLNYRLCETLQRKRPVVFPPLPSFGKWMFPKSILWALLLAFVLPLAVEDSSNPVWTMLELNLKFLVNVFFFLQGLSLVWWWLSKRGVHVLLRILIAILLALPVLGMWVIALGAGDICLDFRKRKPKKL